MPVDSSVKVPGGFLELFGQPPRESACECERSSGMQLGPVLTWSTAPCSATPSSDPNNRIAKIVAANPDDSKVVEELYLAILNRRPTAKEFEIGIAALHGNDEEFAQLQAERQTTGRRPGCRTKSSCRSLSRASKRPRRERRYGLLSTPPS